MLHGPNISMLHGPNRNLCFTVEADAISGIIVIFILSEYEVAEAAP